jgi:hypothetical protein
MYRNGSLNSIIINLLFLLSSQYVLKYVEEVQFYLELLVYEFVEIGIKISLLYFLIMGFPQGMDLRFSQRWL